VLAVPTLAVAASSGARSHQRQPGWSRRNEWGRRRRSSLAGRRPYRPRGSSALAANPIKRRMSVRVPKVIAGEWVAPPTGFWWERRRPLPAALFGTRGRRGSTAVCRRGFGWRGVFYGSVDQAERVGPPRGRPYSDPDPADRLAAEGVRGRLKSTAQPSARFPL